MLAGKGESTNILFNALISDYEIETVILEEAVPRKEFLQKRIKKLGIGKVMGQVLFQISIAKYLGLISSKRRKEILSSFSLAADKIPSQKIIPVRSVNSRECIFALKKINPEIIIVNGTRIISKEVLNCVPAKFINIHAGITPKYRNVHGAYWALVNNDPENCGVTVHLVDSGIDTGNIIYQQQITISDDDNFNTYPVLQLAAGIKLLKKALSDIFQNTVTINKNNLESRIWHHPTLWQYLYYRFVHNIK